MFYKKDTWIELNKKKFINNLVLLKKNNKNKEIWAVVKDNAYHHGICELFKYFLKQGITNFCVVTLEEAYELQKLAEKYKEKINILIMGHIYIEDIPYLESNFRITLYNIEHIKQLSSLKLNKILKVHIKIDTGMNRKGLKFIPELNMAIDILNKNKFIQIEGFYTHFSTSYEDTNFMIKQMKNFLKIISPYIKNVKYIHSQNTFGTINLPKKYSKYNNIIRPGGIMYGLMSEDNTKYKSIFSLYSRILEKKKVCRGESVGYGRDYFVKEDGYIGVIFIGYAHGFRRTNTGLKIYLNGRKVSIIGKICMDQCIFFTKENIFKLYDVVEIIGENNNLYEVAKHNNICDYELICSFSEKIPRIII